MPHCAAPSRVPAGQHDSAARQVAPPRPHEGTVVRGLGEGDAGVPGRCGKLSGTARSIGMIASAPTGTGAPVMIGAAVPGSSRETGCPAAMGGATASARPGTTSAERTA